MKNKIWLFGLVVLLSLIPIAVFAQNQPPVADAGADVTVFGTAAVLLSGTATDPDGDTIVSWLWTIDSAPAGSLPNISDT
jgi:large repetitive protein